MARHRPRYDSYCRPLPELAPVTRRSAVQSPTNQAARRALLTLLEHDYAWLYEAGVYADVTLVLQVQDGTLQRNMQVQVRRQHRREDDTP